MSGTPCETCGATMVADHDTESDGDGGYVSYYTTMYCPDERYCDTAGCGDPTHEVCAECCEPVCKTHVDPHRHECNTLMADSHTDNFGAAS